MASTIDFYQSRIGTIRGDLTTKKRASRASALRADIARGIAGLLVTYPIDPTHWTRPKTPGS